jgi:hypothetical protein
MPQYIPTYPRLQLGDLTGLVDELQLDAKSRFDHWNGHTWDTISISSIIHVESNYPTLLKLRPSLLTELSLVDCPGLVTSLLATLIHPPKSAPSISMPAPLLPSEARVARIMSQLHRSCLPPLGLLSLLRPRLYLFQNLGQILFYPVLLL